MFLGINLLLVFMRRKLTKNPVNGRYRMPKFILFVAGSLRKEWLYATLPDR